MASDNSNNRLGVNRTSSKITKKTNAIPRPAPKIYNIHPSSFRNLVQELTGKDFEPLTLPQPKPEFPPPPPPQTSVNFNARLQRFAPPPLNSGGSTSDGGLKFDFYSLSPIPIVSPGMFSPLTSYTPMEWRWPEDPASASPASLEYNKLAQNLMEQAEKTLEEANYLDSPSVFRQKSSQDSNTKPVVPAVSSGALGSPVSYLRLSPRCGSLSPTFALPSPGSFAGFDLGTI